MTTIPRDWREFLDALRSESTKFLLIGAHALAFHVEARLTEDLDVFVEPTAENGVRVLRALERFGFGGLIADAAEFAVPDRVFMLGAKPWRIDILTGIDGVSFEEAWASRQRVDFHGVELFVIGKEALLRNKRAAGRKKDLMDVALLEASGTAPGPKEPDST
jgi:predicted nucleotidyltransferase